MDLKTISVFIIVCIPFIALTIWAITDVAQKDFGTLKKKVLWWIIASIPFIGFIIYLPFGFRQGEKIDENETERVLK